MKKILLATTLMLGVVTTYAQDMNTAADVVRYSMDNLNGTARFRAMGGAFGALGGDLSAIGINPAGAAVFNYNTCTATLSSYNVANDSYYFGNKTSKTDNSFDLNQAGMVFVFKSSDEKATLNKFTLGFNYDNTNSFDNSLYIRGNNPNHSLADYFLTYANGTPLGNVQNYDFIDQTFAEQQTYLGYYGFVIDPLAETDGNINYMPSANIANSNTYRQDVNTSVTGFNGKASFNFAAQLLDIVYVGVNLNAHFTDHINTTSFTEQYNAGSAAGLQQVRFDTERYTYGGGFSFGIGTIVKATEGLRIGLAYESPAWLRLKDEITQSLSSYCADCDANGNDSFYVDPAVTMVTPDYKIQTPAKYTGSLAYVFGKSAILSVDYSFKDYSNAKFRSPGYSSINSQLNNDMGVAGEVRVGAEYRIKSFSLRGGFRYEESPYKQNSAMGDLHGYSGGLGYAFPGSRLDLAYSWAKRNMYAPPINAGITDPAFIKSIYNNVSLSYTIDL